MLPGTRVTHPLGGHGNVGVVLQASPGPDGELLAVVEFARKGSRRDRYVVPIAEVTAVAPPEGE